MASARKIAVSSKYKVKITKWHVNHEQDIEKGCILANYICYDEESFSKSYRTEKKLRSRFDGKVSKILQEIDVEIPRG